MSKRILFLLVASFSVAVTFAQSKEENIKSIRAEFQAINNDSTLKTVRLDNEEFMEQVPDNGASLTGFYKDGKIRKVVEWFGISWGVSITEFYFKEDRLIFVYRLYKSYGQDTIKMSLDYSRFDVVAEARYYFDNKHLISSITKGQHPFDEDTFNPAKDLPAQAVAHIALLKKKK